ncbi:hypothetical protein [Nocardia sp. XZ_19_369]|uniref:hypothetical protein n=1 Tax=Nocardia sp. XZ_19_369 TaxID=2769487 RepID=UPI0018907DB7|nr:hypothetical protein [Nocardia sp. XZ_19_369]
MPDPSHLKICLFGRGCTCPTVTLFLAPEPLIPGGSILHLLEQAPLADGTAAPTPDADLVDLVQTDSTHADPGPLVRTEFRAFRSGLPDPHEIRTILHDRHITDTAPVGLDLDDSAEMTRLALLPERPIGFRRTEDFQEEAIRRAMLAVYRHFQVDQRIRLTYHGFADPATGWFALRTAIA